MGRLLRSFRITEIKVKYNCLPIFVCSPSYGLVPVHRFEQFVSVMMTF